MPALPRRRYGTSVMRSCGLAGRIAPGSPRRLLPEIPTTVGYVRPVAGSSKDTDLRGIEGPSISTADTPEPAEQNSLVVPNRIVHGAGGPE